ncbi:MAG: ATP-binding protein [Mangrovibacterium sp.]
MNSSKYTQVIADQRLEVEQFELNEVCHRPEEALVDLDSPLAQIVIGVRRCGKSTLCHTVLKKSGVNYAYVNFDDERLATLSAEDLNDVLESLYMVYGDFKHLFLDEIQNVSGWNLFVNRLLRQKMHLIITGSNAKLLSSELSTYLTGRYKQIELFPFSFAEYLQQREIKTNALTTKEVAFRKRAFEDYIREGGFPELANIKDHKVYIKQLVNSIVTVDISQRFKVRYFDALVKITNYMIANFAQELSYKSIAETFGFGSQHTAENYVNYLRQTYLLVGINKFSYKARERVRSEKMYLIDPALLTLQDNNLTGDNLGWRLENVVYLELLRRRRLTDVDIYYYRKSYEIDFVLSKGLEVKELIQVSAFIDNEKTFKRECSALLKASKELKCSKLTLITMGESQTHELNDLLINEVNVVEWLVRG